MSDIIRASELDRRKAGYPPDAGRHRPSRFRKASVVAASWFVDDQASPAAGLIIEGQLKCTAAHHREQVTVARDAQVHADIHANSVMIYGRLVGDIYSDGMVILAKGSEVRGNIYCAGLYIDEDANFLGKVKMDDVSNDAATNRANWPLSC